MTMDSAYIDPFLYDWIYRLQEVMKERGEEIANEKQLIMPREALRTDVVKASAYISRYLDADHHVKYIALELYDTVMNKFFWDGYDEENQSDELLGFKRKFCSYGQLCLVTCFQVACKVNSHVSGLKISQIFQLLHEIDKNSKCTRDMIISMEVDILKKVEFKIPLYTPVYCIEILFAALSFLKIPPLDQRDPIKHEIILDITMDVLDLAYMQHEQLYHHFQLYLECKRFVRMSKEEKELRLRILKSNTLFLSAAIVLCARYILYPNICDLSARNTLAANLAKLVNAKCMDLTTMANILFQIVQYSKE